MDLIDKFQELTGITNKEIAEDILQQFDWNIESAVNCFLPEDIPNDPSRVVGDSCSSPSSDSSHRPTSRLLNFNISFSPDGSNDRRRNVTLQKVSDSRTFGDLKQLFINECRDDLVEMARNSGLRSDNASLLSALRLDGILNSSKLNFDTTLRSLHLPLNNSWTAHLRCYRTRINSEIEILDSTLVPTALDLRIRVKNSSHLEHGTSHVNSSDGQTICLRNISDCTSLSGLKRSAARESGISMSHQVWSIPKSGNPPSNLEVLLRDLNMPSRESNEHRLQRYHLSHSRPYVLELADSQMPSTSQTSNSRGTTGESNRRFQRSKKKSYKELSQDLDDDGEYTIYSDIDDPNGELDFVNDGTNSHSQPLIPSNLINLPEEALENFYNVFIQRYCSTPEDCIPPFLLCSLNDALSQCFNTSRAADRKPLFIYLHNDRSVAAHIFCNRLLCSQQMNQFMEANELKIWPWDVTLEGARANVLKWMQPRLEYLVTEITRMETDQYPLLIMLCKLGGSYEIITILTGRGFTAPTSSYSWSSIEYQDHPMEAFPPLESLSTSTTTPAPPPRTRGKLDAADVVVELWQKYVMYQERLQPEIQIDSQREERELMRMEQDRAYKESLEQDRLKMEAKQREEEEAKQRKKQEQMQAEAAQRVARDRQVASGRALPPEPPVGAANIATLRFRLPTTLPSPPSYEHLSDAEKQPIHKGMIQRRFRAHDTLRDLKNFMEFLGYSVGEFKLLTTFPRIDLTANPSDSVTLAELKLVPQETLNLEQR